MQHLTISESTAAQRRIPYKLVDATDGKTAETGKSPTVTVSKNGAAYGAGGGSSTEIANGLYYYEAAAADLNTQGFLLIHVTATGCADMDLVVAVDVNLVRLEDNIRGTDDDSLKDISDEIAGLNDLSAAEVADAVLQEAVTDHKGTAGSLAEYLNLLRQRAIGKCVIDTGAGTLTIYDTDGTTPLEVLDITTTTWLPQ